jgi:Family of unknown function (DUF6232)
MSEALLSAGQISISQTIAKFGDTSYPIANIGAVSIEEPPHPLTGIGVALVVIGIGLMIFSSFINGLLVGALGAAMAWHFSDKGSAKLMLRTSSGNQQAFESKDRALVRKLKTSIEEAIAARG